MQQKEIPVLSGTFHHNVNIRPLMKYFLLLCLFSICLAASAQQDSMKKFRNEFQHCEELMKNGKYDKAIACLQQLDHNFPDRVKTYVRLAEIFYTKKDKRNVLINANKAIEINGNEAYAPLTYLANKMMSNKDDDLGLLILNRLSASDLDTLKQQKAARNRAQYTLRSYADRTPVPGIFLQNLGDSINTRENEYLPSISLDGTQMVFTRNVGGNEDFFISTKDSNQIWSKAKNLGYPPNTGLPDGAAKLSADGNYIFYTRCDMRSPDGIRGGGCDIVFSYRENGGWSSPQMFGYTINTTAFEGQPCLNSDNTAMYFASNREGGYGGMDIWVSRVVNRLWTKPENLGPLINTGKDETSPFIHPDNETLYFASNGHPGLGSSDLFVARLNKNGTWKTPVNLGAPINTEKFDGSIVVNAKGNIGYCTSDRGNTRGGLDIYAFDLYSAIQPIPTLCLRGFVRDKYYTNKLPRIELDFQNTYYRTSVGGEVSNAGDGSYTKALQMGKTYTIICNDPLYRPYRKTIVLTDDQLPDNLMLDIRLKQAGLIDTLYQCDLLLDSAGHRLDSLSQTHVDSIVHYWKQFIEDSSDVVIFMKSFYYPGDSATDSTYRQNIQNCFARMEMIAKQFEKNKIACHLIMQDPQMLVFKDDELPFRKVELSVVEFY